MRRFAQRGLAGRLKLLFGLASGAVLLSFFLGMLWFNRRSADAQALESSIRKAYGFFLECRESEFEFRIHDLKTEEFFRTGSSRALLRYGRSRGALEASLAEIAIRVPREGEARVAEIRRRVREYEETFLELKDKYFELGFKDWGLEGRWRDSIHGVQDAFARKKSSDLMSRVLEVRRNEKDFLLRKEREYQLRLTRNVELLRKDILAGIKPRKAALQLVVDLDDYQRVFDSYVRLLTEIGMSDDEGLHARISESIRPVETLVGDLLEDANRRMEAAARMLFLGGTGLLLALFALGVRVANATARKIVEPLERLKEAAIEVGKGNLQVEVESTGRGGVNEILVLSRAMGEMVMGLRRFEAQAKWATLGEVAGNIAHELSSPVTALIMQSEMLGQVLGRPSPDLPRVREGVQKIESFARRMTRIISGLRVFSRDGTHDPFDGTNLKSMIDDTLAFMHDKLQDKQVQLLIDPFQEELSLELRATQITQVLVNLVANACDAIEVLSEKWIRVTVIDEGEWVRIRVTDSGSGIPEAIRSRLFKEVYTSKPIGKGTGLGLGLSRRIVLSHGGEMGIQDGPNTCFFFTLPKRHVS